MAIVRSIGRGAMTVLVINTIIGSAIYGVPSEIIRLVGRASPLAMILAALAMAIIMLPIAEVASQFSEPGGMYLYARTAFGRFVGLQVGWFWLLAITGGGAAGANLFISYLAAFFPSVTHGWSHVLAILLLIAIPMVANYVGVREGLILSIFLTITKLLPLGLVIVLGLLHLSHGMSFHSPASIVSPGWNAWLTALLLLIYSYSGYEDALVPTGEVAQPRRTVPFALGTGLVICALVYTLLQFVIVATVGASPSDHPLVDTASVLVGHSGASFVAIAVMVSTYGWISGAFFNAPRFAVSLAAQSDGPAFLGRLHPRFHTPSAGILLYAAAVSILAITGTFLWVVALTAGAMMIFYMATCAALIRLRQLQPDAPALRVPFGPVFAVMGIAISLVLLFQLELRQVALMSITAAIATANWWWARRSTRKAPSEELRGVY
ncbi:MAG: APC family permease [Acidobacteriaceae bacterium]|nr:APC family permease [Acidobacteriaceae bacterium]